MDEKIYLITEEKLKQIISEVISEKEREEFYNRLFTLDETSKILNISKYHIRKLVKQGLLISPVHGRISGSSIIKYIKSL